MHTGENKLRKDHTDIPCALSSMTELSVPLFNLFHEVFLMFYMSDTFFLHVTWFMNNSEESSLLAKKSILQLKIWRALL